MLTATVNEREISADFRVIYDRDHTPSWGVQAHLPDGSWQEIFDPTFHTRTDAQREVDRLRRLWFALTKEEKA